MFQKIWASVVKWFNGLLDNADIILQKLIAIALILIVARLTIAILNKIIKKIVLKKQKKLESEGLQNVRKAETLATLAQSITKYMVYFFALATILNELGLGVTAGSILATAGIGGVALGLGAQGLIKDVVAGFFLLFEEQFNVGEFVEIAGVKGTVEAVTLRTTNIRAYTGELHIIPNGMIDQVTNYHRGTDLAQIGITILSAPDIEATMKIMLDTASRYAKHEGKTVAVEPPSMLGVSSVSQEGITINMVFRVKAQEHYQVERDLLKLIYEKLAEKGIAAVSPSRLTIVREEQHDRAL